MMRSMLRCGCGVGGLVMLVATAGAQTLPARPLEYAVFGLEGVRLGAFTRVQGDVGTNAGDVVIRPGARVEGALAGETLVLRRGGRATTLYCVQVQGGRKDCQRLPDPVVDNTSLPVVQVSPGSESVTVRRRARRVPLDAGRYRDVHIGAGSTLMLAGGAYSFRSLGIDPRGRLVCVAPCQIAVRTTVSIGRRGRIELLAGDGGDGSLQVQGGGRRGAVTAAAGTHITAAVYAPTSDVVVGARLRLTGSLVGRSVTVGAHGKLVRSNG